MLGVLWPELIANQFLFASEPFDIVGLIGGVNIEVAVFRADGAIAIPRLEDVLLRR